MIKSQKIKSKLLGLERKYEVKEPFEGRNPIDGSFLCREKSNTVKKSFEKYSGICNDSVVSYKL